MVKGSTRQVIVVKSPHQTLFEEAIFIVKEDAIHRPGVTAEVVMAQAQKAAHDYIHREDMFYSTGGMHGLLWALMGMGLASALWGFGLYFFL